MEQRFLSSSAILLSDAKRSRSIGCSTTARDSGGMGKTCDRRATLFLSLAASPIG